ncbi:MAG TPA: hypothetical protein VGW38_18920, partial [Chloroflexota bacterium]|nr:hypothetical protein [Chloroflexota bacterium]
QHSLMLAQVTPSVATNEPRFGTKSRVPRTVRQPHRRVGKIGRRARITPHQGDGIPQQLADTFLARGFQRKGWPKVSGLQQEKRAAIPDAARIAALQLDIGYVDLPRI